MTVSAPASNEALKAGRWTSRRLASEISTKLYSMPPLTPPYAAKCFGQARREAAAPRSSPWKPRTRAFASSVPRWTSSPEPSATRPQRWSRATSTIGAKVQWMPRAVASSAVARAVRRASSGSKLAASPRGMGKTVRSPWMTSAAKISGMPRRLSSTAMRCSSTPRSTPMPLKRHPQRPSRTAWAMPSGVNLASSGLMPNAAMRYTSPRHVSWPAFSSGVILEMRSSMRALWASRPRPAIPRAGAARRGTDHSAHRRAPSRVPGARRARLRS
mmetsp:Transcript_35901/g.101056  ORF Transcript_35901/g.101056 Transcript_35901/m.101056 type:complete len:272 (+) Transcript_35901:1621-2436(+)